MSHWMHGVQFRSGEQLVRFWMRDAGGLAVLPPRPATEGCAFRVEFREHFADGWIAFVEFASLLDLLHGRPTRSGTEPAEVEEEPVGVLGE